MDPGLEITLLLSAGREVSTGRYFDVVARLSQRASVEDLCLALDSYLGSRSSSGRLALCCTRLGTLAMHELIVNTGLRSGDILTLTEGVSLAEASSNHLKMSSSPPENAVAELLVHAGPQAGRRLSLPVGCYVLGRDPACEEGIALLDPSVSRRHLRLSVDREAVSISDLSSSNGFAVEGDPASAVRLDLGAATQVEVGRSVIAFRRPAPVAIGSDSTSEGTRLFNRAPRIATPYAPPRLNLGPVPRETNLGKLQLLAVFAPIALGVPTAFILGQWELLLSVLLTPVLWSSLAERGTGHRSFQRSVAGYERKLRELGAQLEQARAAERDVRRAASPDAIASAGVASRAVGAPAARE